MAQIPSIIVGARKSQGMGLGDGVEIPSGPYLAKLVSDEINKNGNYTAKVEIVEGEHAGVTRFITLGTDMAKEGNQNSWYTFFKSFGLAESDIQDTFENFDTEVLVGQQCRIGHRAKNPEAKTKDDKGFYSETRFITEENYNEMLEKIATENAGEAGAAAAASVETPAAKPRLGAAKPPAPAPTAVPKPTGPLSLQEKLNRAARK